MIIPKELQCWCHDELGRSTVLCFRVIVNSRTFDVLCVGRELILKHIPSSTYCAECHC